MIGHASFRKTAPGARRRRHLVRAWCRRSRDCVTRSRDEQRIRWRGTGAGSHRGNDRNTRAADLARICPISGVSG